MSSTQRREQAKEALRTRIVEAARDIVSELGLDALSMRALAERIEYSPATIYLYFRDKDELLREVVQEGFRRLTEKAQEETEAVGPEASPTERHRALGRAYARFALENTAYFRVMFELPTVARVGHEKCRPEGRAEAAGPWCDVVRTVQQAIDEGLIEVKNAEHTAVIAWGLVHGLTSLYLSGHLSEMVDGHDSFLELLELAMASLGFGWRPRETSAREVS
ncbi:MAG TPA: TetR/AcrR family transcriptional regulator [Longimicrobiaceae bacterium]